MKRYMNSMSKGGSISLETAISFSIVLVFITAIISVTVFLRTDILMQRAVSQSCDDIAHFMPFSVLLSDSVSTLVNALPDEYEDDGTVERAGEVIAAADNLTGGELRAGMLNVLLGQRFTDDIALNEISNFEKTLHEYIGSNCKDFINEFASNPVITDEVQSKLNEIVSKVANDFKLTRAN